MAKDKIGGKYGNNTAGDFHELVERDWGVKREFIGSAIRTYTFYSDKLKTILIVHADSWEDAKRIARERGFKQYRKSSIK